MQRVLDIPLPVDAQLHKIVASKYPTGAEVVPLAITGCACKPQADKCWLMQSPIS